ncbi:MAG: hypothetical protein H7Y09_10610 [Chitinophagaceae bacterium]|nr:hypothetical protein [Anaerolineae bacterium]
MADKHARKYAYYRHNIIQQIKKKQQEDESGKARSVLMGVLNGLNAMGALSRCDPPGMITYGPTGFHGLNWAGAVMWCKPSDYHGYKILTLLGVWAQMDEGIISLTIGTRLLPFQAAFYDAGGYHTAIQRGFQSHYEDKGTPPPESDCLWMAVYTAERRLALRAEIETVLREWLEKN